MDIKIFPSSVSGQTVAPPSKSYAIRNCIATCLYGAKGVVKNVGNSKDVTAVINCLIQMGYKCDCKDGDFYVDGYERKENPLLDCDESASCLRFLLAVCSALGIKAKFTGKDALLNRPISPLVDLLNDHGANVKDLCVNGKIENGRYVVRADESSQFISGLLLALCTFQGQSRIIVKGRKVSKKYIDMTVEVINSFGERIKKTKRGFDILPLNKPEVPSERVVSGDYSGSANFLVLGALTGSVSVKGLKPDSLQGDKKIVDLLDSFGAKITANNDTVSAEKQRLGYICVDCQNIIDLVPVLAVLGACGKGATLLKNVDRLKIKESDRLNAVMQMLSVAKINYAYTDGNLTVYGGKPKGGVFDSFNDHRIAMACVVLATFCQEESVVLNADCIEKSFESFLVDYKNVGGKYSVVI